MQKLIKLLIIICINKDIFQFALCSQQSKTCFSFLHEHNRHTFYIYSKIIMNFCLLNFLILSKTHLKCAIEVYCIYDSIFLAWKFYSFQEFPYKTTL